MLSIVGVLLNVCNGIMSPGRQRGGCFIYSVIWSGAGVCKVDRTHPKGVEGAPGRGGDVTSSRRRKQSSWSTTGFGGSVLDRGRGEGCGSDAGRSSLSWVGKDPEPHYPGAMGQAGKYPSGRRASDGCSAAGMGWEVGDGEGGVTMTSRAH